MRAFLALIRREFWEHRGGFLYAPAAILLLLGAGIVLMALNGRAEVRFFGPLDTVVTIFEFAFASLAGLWWVYLLVALAFYFADSFWADRRNNAMLFWKSMPQADWKMLAAKMAAGLTVFPLLILVAALVTGILTYAGTLVGGTLAGRPNPLGIVPALAAYGQIGLSALVFYALGILWYVPYFAWIGLLGALFGRWSMPFGILIPAVIIVLERLLCSPTGGSAIYDYLLWRSQFGFSAGEIAAMIAGDTGNGAATFTQALLARIDWLSMLAGWLFALVMIALAGEHRRRTLS